MHIWRHNKHKQVYLFTLCCKQTGSFIIQLKAVTALDEHILFTSVIFIAGTFYLWEKARFFEFYFLSEGANKSLTLIRNIAFTWTTDL